jgi:hypothetical protein
MTEFANLKVWERHECSSYVVFLPWRKDTPDTTKGVVFLPWRTDHASGTTVGDIHPET